MEPLSAIGARVRTYRKRRGLTQEELAGRIGRSAEALSVLERGRSTPTLPVLGRLSDALAVPLRDFFAPAETLDQSPQQAAQVTTLLDCARDPPPPELTLAVDILTLVAAYHASRAGQAGDETQDRGKDGREPAATRAPDPPRDTLAMLLRLYNNDRQAITATLTRRRRFLMEMGDDEDAAFLDELLKLLWER